MSTYTETKKELGAEARDYINSNGVSLKWVAPQIGMTADQLDRKLRNGIDKNELHNIEKAVDRAVERKF